MISFQEAVRVRVFISENDKYEGWPLYEQIVYKAKELNMSGATVLRGILGFKMHSQIHSAKLLTISEDLPLVVEIVDSEKGIEKLMPFLDKIASDKLITIENVKLVNHRSKK